MSRNQNLFGNNVMFLKPSITTTFLSNFQGLVLAGLKDLARAAYTLSIAQTLALFFTGCIWSRYSLVIIPKNWSLFAVNAFVALTQSVQLGRAIHYHFFTDHADGELILPTNSSLLSDIITSDGSGYGPILGNLTAGPTDWMAHDGVIWGLNFYA